MRHNGLDCERELFYHCRNMRTLRFAFIEVSEEMNQNNFNVKHFWFNLIRQIMLKNSVNFFKINYLIFYKYVKE